MKINAWSVGIVISCIAPQLSAAQQGRAETCNRDSLVVWRTRPDTGLARQVVTCDSLLTLSQRMMGRSEGHSYVMLSLIKSIAGEIPANEFFEIRLKFAQQTVNTFLLSTLDVALSTSQSDSSQKRLTDAGVSLNQRIIPAPWRPLDTARPSLAFVGAVAKIFDTRSYAGLEVGGLALRPSRLEGSSITVAVLHSLYRNQDTTLAPDAKWNVFFEFYLRVPEVQFLDKLRIRGGVLLPIDFKRQPLSRITLMVPIADLERF